MIIQQASNQGLINFIVIDGNEEELKKLAFFLMDAIDQGTAQFTVGGTAIAIRLTDEDD